MFLPHCDVFENAPEDELPRPLVLTVSRFCAGKKKKKEKSISEKWDDESDGTFGGEPNA